MSLFVKSAYFEYFQAGYEVQWKYLQNIVSNIAAFLATMISSDLFNVTFVIIIILADKKTFQLVSLIFY